MRKRLIISFQMESQGYLNYFSLAGFKRYHCELEIKFGNSKILQHITTNLLSKENEINIASARKTRISHSFMIKQRVPL